MANGTVDHPGIGQYRSQQTGESISADGGHRGEVNHPD